MAPASNLPSGERASDFVMDWIARLSRESGKDEPPRAALDLATGRGRHAWRLARAGFKTFAVDISFEMVREVRAIASRDGVDIACWCADLNVHPLPESRFDLVVVTRYLDRELFPAIRATVVPGGVVLYETFTAEQLALGWGPKSPAHLLHPGELRTRFEGFDELAYEEVSAPEAVARIVARRRS
ncbi:MAG TPA: class I SAM-dependent methyltransferase [Vicinamibacterales bacterium]|jgi:tellurite methyltransferase|nr:class I SAM-dependent methyltransferase [Vicinamibacterales bacterium]